MTPSIHPIVSQPHEARSGAQSEVAAKRDHRWRNLRHSTTVLNDSPMLSLVILLRKQKL